MADSRGRTVPALCAAEVIELAYGVGYHIREALRQHPDASVSQSQLRCLMFLAGPGGRTMSDTAAFLGLTLPSTSKLIDELVRHRLVTRHADPQDRRRAKLAITPAGRTTLRTLLGGASGEIARRLASLPAAELRVIHRALSTIAPLLAITPVTEVARAG